MESVEETVQEAGSLNRKKPRAGRWLACFFLLAFQTLEVMMFHGISTNLVIFLTTKLHKGTVNATRDVNNWLGVSWVAPILGAYVGDTHLGSFWSVVLFATLCIPGVLLLTTSVWLLRKSPCEPQNMSSNCRKVSPIHFYLFYVALYMIAVGRGASNPNITATGAGQFDDSNEKEKLERGSFYNWWIFSGFLGFLITITVMVYVQDNYGFRWGYGILAIAYSISVCILLLGIPFFRRSPPKGNPFKEISQVFIAAIRKYKVSRPTDPSHLHELDLNYYNSSSRSPLPNTPSLRFLDKAAIKNENYKGQWSLCTVTQVEETKVLIRLLPIWFCNIVPCIGQSQLITLFIKQATTLDRKIGSHNFEIPAASLGTLFMIPMMITIVVYDKLFVKLLRKFTGHSRGISVLKRIGVGFGVQTLAMVAASITDSRRMQMVREYGDVKGAIPVSVFILAPQFVLFGMSIALYEPALVEFFYSEAPESMKSTSTALLFLSNGAGFFLSSVFLTVTNAISKGTWVKNDLNSSALYYYFALLAVVGFLNLLLFSACSRAYVYGKGKVASIVVSDSPRSMTT